MQFKCTTAYRVLISLVLQRKGRSYFGKDKGDRTLGRKGRSLFPKF
ncbi:hypothetical protein QUA56_14945 [Microcoleus sp. N3A4]